MIAKKEDFLRQRDAELAQLRRDLSIHLALNPDPDDPDPNQSASKIPPIPALNALTCSDLEHDDLNLDAIPLLPFKREQLEILRLLRIGVSIADAVKNRKLSRSAFNNWVSRYPHFRRAAKAVREEYRENVADDIEPLHNTAREWLEFWINGERTSDSTRLRAIGLLFRYIHTPHLLPRRIEQLIPYTLNPQEHTDTPATQAKSTPSKPKPPTPPPSTTSAETNGDPVIRRPWQAFQARRKQMQAKYERGESPALSPEKQAG